MREVHIIDARNPFVASTGTIQTWRLPEWYCANVAEKLYRKFAAKLRKPEPAVVTVDALDVRSEEFDIIMPKREAIKKGLQTHVDIWYIRNDMCGSDNRWGRSRIYKEVKRARHLYHGRRTNKWARADAPMDLSVIEVLARA